jgi:hypothetical protein
MKGVTLTYPNRVRAVDEVRLSQREQEEHPKAKKVVVDKLLESTVGVVDSGKKRTYVCGRSDRDKKTSALMITEYRFVAYKLECLQHQHRHFEVILPSRDSVGKAAVTPA